MSTIDTAPERLTSRVGVEQTPGEGTEMRMEMNKWKTFALSTALLCFAATSHASDVPSGQYMLDKAHASLIFRVDHLGFSNYTARFTNFDAELAFSAQVLADSTLNATVDVSSLETDFPNPDVVDFNAMLTGPDWLDAKQFPTMSFTSTHIEMTAENSGLITGDLTLHGVTSPVALEATFNGGYRGHPRDPHARIGFSAHGELLRSAFGIDFGIPEPGSSMGVSDRVEIIIEVEFSGPPVQ